MNNFDVLYKQLNDAQKKAVDTIEGPVVVIAGPGTGKTTILIMRIANIIRLTDTLPQNILALTFTESGAYAMRKKLVEIIGLPAYKVNIHTFHGFAQKIIEQYPDYFTRIIGSRVITEPEQIKIISTIIGSKKIKILRPYGDKDYYVKPILKEIQILKRENISPLKFKESLYRTDLLSNERMLEEPSSKKKSDTLLKEKLKKQKEKNMELAYVFNEYEKALLQEKYYDFEDMLLELVRAMEDSSDFKLMLQENYQYILADEHQDANAAQNRILELLSDFHDSPNLFIVGDDKQAIYRFQGATLDNFLYFSKKYPDTLIINLEHNYRSHQGILDASFSLILNNPQMGDYERKRLISLQIGSMPIFITVCKNKEEELDLIARSIRKMIESGTKSEEIAILYRDNKHALEISKALNIHDVLHRIESDHNILDEIDPRKIIILVKAIHNPANSENLAKALFLKELSINPAHVQELCEKARKEKIPLYRLIKGFKDTNSAYEKIVKWKNISMTLSCADFIHKVIVETKMIEDILKDKDSLKRIEILQSFYEHIISLAQSKKTFLLSDFIEYLEITLSNELNVRQKNNDWTNGVRLMTAHRAKGLEFRHVFIIHVNDKIWGNKESRHLFNIPIIEHARNMGRIEDERRLFYVAMTRARETVHITYSESDGEKELLPSCFIGEIDRKFVDFDEIPAFEKDEKIKQFVNSFQEKTIKSSILEKDIIGKMFSKQSLSVTHLNNYLECPWKYFFVNLLHIPETKTKHQMYGTAIHTVLRLYFNALKEGRKISSKQIVKYLENALSREAMSKGDRKESYEKGKRALLGYLEENGKNANEHLLTEYSIQGIPIDISDLVNKNSLGEMEDKIYLSGKLDKVEFLTKEEVVVIDYKTSKPKSRNEIEGKTKTSKSGNQKRQLVFYKLLIDHMEEKKTQSKGKMIMKYGEIHFIEPNERGLYKKERFEITEDEVVSLIKTIKEMAKTIIDLDFLNQSCDDKDCEYCILGQLLKENKKK